jgi:hypothetical protein
MIQLIKVEVWVVQSGLRQRQSIEWITKYIIYCYLPVSASHLVPPVRGEIKVYYMLPCLREKKANVFIIFYIFLLKYLQIKAA